jgi:hypothetical protein
MRRNLARLVAVIVGTLLMLGGGIAFGDTQPTQGGAAEDVREEPDVLPAGPHCHTVRPAAGKGPFDQIVSLTRHQAHVQTGLTDGIFDGAACP